jgi:hypothetical protein
VPIIAKVEGSIPPHDEVYRIKLRDIVWQYLDKTDLNRIAKIGYGYIRGMKVDINYC